MRWIMLLVFVGMALPLYAQSDLTPFEQEGRWGYRDVQGRTVIAPRFELAQEFTSDGTAPVLDKDGWAYIDRQGKIIVRPLLVDNGPDYFAEGLVRFREQGRIGFIDTRGRIVIKPRFTYAAPFSGGLAAVCLGCTPRADGEYTRWEGGHWGYVNKDGQVVIPPIYEVAEPFSQGRARVRRGQHWIYIDAKGRVIEDAGDQR